MSTLYIIRGLPGSGKSTLAKIIAQGCKGFHVETDQFFSRGGGYCFDASRLAEAHNWCQETVLFNLKAGCDTVVSNTFSCIWEMQPYLNMGFPVVVIECQSQFENIHNVPSRTIEKMKARWEKYHN